MQSNAAIVGLGFVGRAHLEALRRLGISVQGVLGSTPERSKSAGESLHLPRAYSSLDELAADASVHVVHSLHPERPATFRKPVNCCARARTSSVRSHWL